MPVKVQDPPRTACFHCGADCYPVKIERDEHSFCCEGCHTVYSILQENGMDKYYSLNNHPGKTANERSGKYDFLDREDVQNRLVEYQDEEIQKVKFRAPAIHCSSCIWLLEHLYKLKPGITKSEVNFPKKEVYISFEKSVISMREVVELMAAIGYAPELSLESLEGKKRVSPNRKTWFQLGIAGFCFGNIMLFSFPEYLGIDDPGFIRLFGILNVLFAIPILVYSAQDYFRQAYLAIRSRRINMDVPIAVGIAVLFGRSLGEIAAGAGAGFLDSLAGLVFFLLLGKIFQNKTYDALSFDRDYKSYFPISVTKLTPDGEEEIPLSMVKSGDRLLIRNGELVPADSILLDGEARLDYSFVTGESRPVSKVAGALVYAGGRQSGSAIRLEAVKDVAQSYLTRLWDDEAFRKRERADVTRLSDKVGQVFTWVVLGIALSTLAFWLWWNPEYALETVTAVLIVACPCALAMSTPFSLGNALRILGKRHFFAKGIVTMETLAHANTIVFDKTGTLTENLQGGVKYVGDTLSESESAAIKSLLRQSTHPLSRRIYTLLQAESTHAVESYREVAGKGIEGWVNGQWVQVGSPSFVGLNLDLAKSAGSKVAFNIEGKVQGCWFLEGKVREGVAETLANLSAHYNLVLLSGDDARETSQWAGYFPQDSTLLFNQSPGDKLDFIRAEQAKGNTVIMVGDGLNDAGALAASDVGVSIAEDISSFTPASDVILKGSELNQLPSFLRFAKASLRMIYASFGLSFLYNIVGISFAVTGNLSPLVAAILMPLSSISVIVFATLGTNILARRILSNPK